MKWACFGCGDEDHVFLRGGMILRPNDNDPAIKVKADAKFKEISDRAKDCAKQQVDMKRRSAGIRRILISVTSQEIKYLLVSYQKVLW